MRNQLLSNFVCDSRAVRSDITKYTGSKQLCIKYYRERNCYNIRNSYTFDKLVALCNWLLEHDVDNIEVTLASVITYSVMLDTDPMGQFDDLDRETVFEVSEHTDYNEACEIVKQLNADQASNREYFVRKNKKTLN